MIRQIVAVDSNMGIAKDGKIPWNIPKDGAYFEKMSKKFGGRVLMTRGTYEYIGSPLTGRQNIIISRDKNFKSKGVTSVSALNEVSLRDDLWIIGGEWLYEKTLDITDEVYITRIDADFDCDKFFPEFEDNFKLISKSPKQPQNDLSFHFEIWQKST